MNILEFFNTSGHREKDDDVIYTIAEGDIPASFGLVTGVRIMNHVESQNWLVLSEVRQLLLYIYKCEQGIIVFTGTKTFAMEPELAKLLWRLKLTPVLN